LEKSFGPGHVTRAAKLSMAHTIYIEYYVLNYSCQRTDDKHFK